MYNFPKKFCQQVSPDSSAITSMIDSNWLVITFFITIQAINYAFILGYSYTCVLAYRCAKNKERGQ